MPGLPWTKKTKLSSLSKKQNSQENVSLFFFVDETYLLSRVIRYEFNSESIIVFLYLIISNLILS